MASSGVACIKWLLFVFNFLFFLTGAGLLGLGIWLNVDRNDWKGISDYNYISVANVLIAAGAIIIVIAFSGCCGALTENKIMLMLFFVFLCLVFLVELVAGITAYVWRGKIEEGLKKQLNERIPDKYFTEDGLRIAMNTIQKQFECCGINGISDWSGYTVDKSCCKKSGVLGSCDGTIYTPLLELPISNYNTKGCYESIEQFLKDHLIYVGSCAIVFALIQILGMIFSMTLYCALQKEGKLLA